MKLFLKMLAAVSSVLVLSATVSLAATYDSTNGQVNLTDADKGDITDNNMIAVMVVPAEKVNNLSNISADDILYIDQGTAFSTFVNMGVKGSSLTAGKYAICVGANTATEPNIQYFEVGSSNDSIGMLYKKSADNVSNPTMRDFLYIVQIDNYKSDSNYGLKMSYKNNSNTLSATFEFPTDIYSGVTGEAGIKIGAVMNKVPTDFASTFDAEPCIISSVQQNKESE